MSFLMPQAPNAPSAPPIPPQFASSGVAMSGAAARQAAAAAAGQVKGFGNTVNTSAQGVAKAPAASKSLFAT